MRSVGEHFCGNDSTSIPLYLKTSLVLFERSFGEPLKNYHGFSFFFLQNAKHSCVSSSFFLKRRKKDAEIIHKELFKKNIKNLLKITR